MRSHRWWIACFWTANALLQGGIIYSMDQNWLTALPWALFIAGIGWAFYAIHGAMFSTAGWLARHFHLERARCRITAVLGVTFFGGALFGPHLGLLAKMVFIYRASALFSAEMGLVVGSVLCGGYMLAIALSRSRALRHADGN